MKERKIYLLRHGQPELKANKKIYIGKTDIDLSIEGIKQAEKLREKFKNAKFENVYCSDLKRTKETAQIIAQYHEKKINIIKDLGEIHLGDWEGLCFDQVRMQYPEEFKKRGDNIIHYCTPNGESFFDLNKRVTKAFDQILSETYKDILIVAHAGVNRLILCNILHMPIENIFKIPQKYACVNIILQKNEQLIVESLNEGYEKEMN